MPAEAVSQGLSKRYLPWISGVVLAGGAVFFIQDGGLDAERSTQAGRRSTGMRFPASLSGKIEMLTMAIADKIYEAVKPLPEALAREVLDFIVFLRARREHETYDSLAAAQTSSMAGVWDNPDDEVWNDAASG